MLELYVENIVSKSILDISSDNESNAVVPLFDVSGNRLLHSHHIKRHTFRAVYWYYIMKCMHAFAYIIYSAATFNQQYAFDKYTQKQKLISIEWNIWGENSILKTIKWLILEFDSFRKKLSASSTD